MPLRLSAALCVLCVKWYFNAEDRREPQRSQRLFLSLPRPALFEQQIVSLYDNLVSGTQTVDDFHAVIVLNSSLHLALLVTIAIGDENNCLSLVIENR